MNSPDPWTLVYDGFEAASEGSREALCTLGNGVFATRGATPEETGARTPGTYAAGCYDRLTSMVAGRAVTNEDIVNLPDWLPLTFATPGAPWFRPQDVELLEYRQELDMRHGVLHRFLRYRDTAGRTTSVRQRRLVSMADPHLAALSTTFTAEDWAGTLRVRSALEGRVANRGVERYRALRGDHLIGHAADGTPGTTWLSARTRQSGILITIAARLYIDQDTVGRVESGDGWIAEEHDLDLRTGMPVTVTKTVALTTSRDPRPTCPRELLSDAPGFCELQDRHRAAWNGLWERARLDVDGPQVSQIVHLHVFHLLQTLSPHTAGLDVGVPARGLHGEAYRGHVFWDELFVLPWLDLRFPEISQAVIRYRWRRLPQARAAAREAGYAGAMFPWQSGSDGREESQTLHLNPASGHWLPDHSSLQRHVGLAITHNVWHHYTATGDTAFLAECGAELLVEIARCFASLAVLDPASGRYEIHGVMGPDEYHDAYPGAPAPGLSNNAYTNVMTAWLMPRACEAVRVTAWPGVSEAELARWDDISRRIRVDFHQGVISQFSGYADLEELDWRRYAGIRRLDRALEADGDDPNRYKASKQADVLMLCYLLSAEELTAVLTRLGYPPKADLIPRTVAYYLERTCHGSTLSAVVHAWVLARTDRAASWLFFAEALTADVEDVQDGTTREGIHLGAMAGTLDLVQRCFLGLRVTHEGILLDPLVPERLGQISFPVRVRGAALSIDADPDRVTVTRNHDGPDLIEVTLRTERIRLMRGASHTFDTEQEKS
ncbi:glycosyl hydrolase family 65 protein [Spongiactinospora sp. TRM90649]|uniref:glycoside hydrolase family 65 protein n=1 Tax=Spongiactinospora sp. TRM90649 TaxID=3031114 RepID=UPI0023F7902F|nr:glycosyl hydrolase family 65 protein [Spongiactinospora sp. TRM90649]MDF5755232.1 glycosyl hydrolase family 65 protein [Spongiactinospora sp. TRM90649]